jgi:hypothetical protein
MQLIEENQFTFEEVGLKVDIENIATEAFDGVVERQDMHSLSIFNVEALVNIDEIA